MKHIKTLAIGLAMGALAAPSVYAEDKHFDGFFVGGEFGVNIMNVNEINNDEHVGFYYGGILGIRKQTDSNFVFGLEGTFGDTDNSLAEERGFGLPAPVDVRYRWSTYATFGKVFGASRKNMIFGKIGYHKFKFRLDFDFPPAFEVPPQLSRSFKRDGLLLGVGYERSLSDSINLRFGVDYTDSDSIDQWQPKASLLVKF